MGDLVSLTGRLEARRGCLRATSAVDWYERGLAHEAADQPDAAIVAYRRALDSRAEVTTSLADACNNLGRLLHDRDQLGEAESLYRIAICASALEPGPSGELRAERGVYNGALYWFNLGVVLEDAGRCAEAIRAYEQALALDSTLADAHFNLARQLEQVGRRSTDELVLRRAVRHLKRYRDLVRTA